MQNASFSIINYQFEKVNIDLSNHTPDNLSINFDTHGVFIKENSVFELTFSVSVFNKETEENPFVNILCKGLYQFENVSDMVDIPAYFYGNSIAILFPYVRAYISLVTTQANVPGIILPTYNLSSLQDILRKNTIQK